MRRTALSAAVVFAACGAAHGTMLQSGDLELPLDAPNESDLIDGWTLVEPDTTAMGDPVNTATFVSFANHTPGGDRGLWLRPWAGGAAGDPPSTNATLYQDVAGAPGAKYALSAWFLFEAHYSGLDPAVPTMTILALDFLDAGHGTIGTAELDVDTVGINDSTWRQYMVMGVSPAGTAFVRARLSMVEGVFEDANPQSAFVDDFELIPTPATSALLLAMCGAGAAPRRRRH